MNSTSHIRIPPSPRTRARPVAAVVRHPPPSSLLSLSSQTVTPPSSHSRCRPSPLPPPSALAVNLPPPSASAADPPTSLFFHPGRRPSLLPPPSSLCMGLGPRHRRPMARRRPLCHVHDSLPPASVTCGVRRCPGGEGGLAKRRHRWRRRRASCSPPPPCQPFDDDEPDGHGAAIPGRSDPLDLLALLADLTALASGISMEAARVTV